MEPLPGDEDGLGWRTRVRFAVRPGGLAGLRQHRSHEIIDIGTCPIAHPLVNEAAITRGRWPGATSVAAVTSPGTDERAVVVTPARAPRAAGRPGPGRGPPAGPQARPAASTAAWAEQVTGPVLVAAGSGGLTALRGGPFLHRTAAGRTWRTSAGVFWQVHPAAADVLAGVVSEVLRAAARGRGAGPVLRGRAVRGHPRGGRGPVRGGDRHRIRPGRRPRCPAQPPGYPLGPGPPG